MFDEQFEINQRCAICCAPRKLKTAKGIFYCGRCHDGVAIIHPTSSHWGEGTAVPIPYGEWTRNG